MNFLSIHTVENTDQRRGVGSQHCVNVLKNAPYRLLDKMNVIHYVVLKKIQHLFDMQHIWRLVWLKGMKECLDPLFYDSQNLHLNVAI